MTEIEFSMKSVTVRRKREPKVIKSRYDPIIDKFLEGDDKLVEIEVPGKKGSYVVSQLSKRIKKRKLEITVESVGNYVYLEKS